MKVTITEFRSLLAEAVRQVVAEAKRKPKLHAPRSEESIADERDRQLRGLPGFHHSEPNSFAKPLGKRNIVKRQGAAGMGNWTSEALEPSGGSVKSKAQELMAFCKWSGMDQRKATEYVARYLKQNSPLVNPEDNGLDDPQDLGIESTPMANEGLKALVRMVVDEEVRVKRGR
jgi:hypothetical protein